MVLGSVAFSAGVGIAGRCYGDSTLTPLVSFAYGDDPSELTADASGNFYGMTLTGTLFKISGTNHQTYTPLATGLASEATVAFGKDGNLYGISANGGTYGDGSVFELSGPGFQNQTILQSFNVSNGTIGGISQHLAVDASGNLYGTTAFGGTYNSGTLFELSGASHQTMTTIINFNSSSSTGGLPLGSLYIDSAGNIFGTSVEGGQGGDGTVYEVSPNHTVTNVASFTGYGSGAPLGGLVADSAGNLFGIMKGGTYENGNGAVYELSGTNHQTVTILASGVGGTDYGGNTTYPGGELAIDSSGNLYFADSYYLAQYISQTQNNVYELSGANHQTRTTLLTQRGGQLGGMNVDSAGNLIGVGSDNGANSGGMVFEITQTAPPDTTPTVLSNTAPAGTNQTVTVSSTSGSSTTALAVQATFASTTGGTLNVSTGVESVAALGSTNPYNASTPTFTLPADGSNVQIWDFSYSGSFTGDAQIVLSFDPTGMTLQQEENLQVYHYTDDQWVDLGGTVNLTNDTITAETPSFSPFALGVAAVPEPATTSIMAISALGLLSRRRRNRRIA